MKIERGRKEGRGKKGKEKKGKKEEKGKGKKKKKKAFSCDTLTHTRGAYSLVIGSFFVLRVRSHSHSPFYEHWFAFVGGGGCDCLPSQFAAFVLTLTTFFTHG